MWSVCENWIFQASNADATRKREGANQETCCKEGGGVVEETDDREEEFAKENKNGDEGQRGDVQGVDEDLHIGG